MTDKPARIVDAHVHLWDPANTSWYPYLSMTPSHGGSGDASRMNRRFDIPTYKAESSDWNVEKIVNVAAATGPNSVEETIELDRTADANGGPDAIVGGLPPTETVADAVALLDRQMTAPRFRGVRPMGPLTQPVPEPRRAACAAGTQPCFRADDPSRPADVGRRATSHPLPTWSSWSSTPAGPARPPTTSSPSGRRASTPWPRQATTSSASSPVWPCRSVPWTRKRSLRGWSTPSRCSDLAAACSPATFPSMPWPGTFDELYSAFSAITDGLDAVARDQLFAATAERVYGL